MWLLVTSPSTTSKRIGRPRGQRKAERRLKREIANKYALSNAISEISSVARTIASTAATNPIVGTVLGVSILGVLHRFKILGDGDYIAGLGLIGVIDIAAAAQALGTAIGSAAAGAGSIIPSSLVPFTSSSKSINISSGESLIANSPNVATSAEIPAKPVIQEKDFLATTG